jgi:23S rRNA (pseudouridine1915-N3)-methyltransferase
MKLRLVWIGRTKNAAIRSLIEQYAERIGKFVRFEIIELRDRSGLGGDLRRAIEKEGEDLLASISSDQFVVLLDERGQQLDSLQFAEFVRQHQVGGTKLMAFIVGGHAGVSEVVRERADFILALSRMTLTHEIARALLLEQLYRAFTIIHDLPYQK